MAFQIGMRLTWKGREIRSEKDRPEGIAIRAWRYVAKASFRAMGFYWHENFLQLHFGSAARRRYGSDVVKERTTKWVSKKLKIAYTEVYAAANIARSDSKDVRQRKLQRARQQLVASRGGADYNHYKGTLRQAVKTVYMRAFPGRFSLQMPVPGYIPGRRKSAKDPDIRAELTAMLPSEMKEMHAVAQRVLVRSMQEVLSTGRVPQGDN